VTGEAVNPYVNARLQYFRKLMQEAQPALEWLREATRKGETVTLERALYEALALPVQEFRNLAYGLDEAMAALSYYANEETWREVPEKTSAAEDRGTRARVAMARIDPV